MERKCDRRNGDKVMADGAAFSTTDTEMFTQSTWLIQRIMGKTPSQ